MKLSLKGLLKYIRRPKKDKNKKIFFTSDLHLDHTNIIKYCHRPFRSKDEMNYILVDNWNKTVSKKDTVYFLGDLAYGRGSRSIDYWISKLNGHIIFIRGNHDKGKSKIVKIRQRYILDYKGYRFLLIHNPYYFPYYPYYVNEEWDGWIIHGHHHNNDIKQYPFINSKNKTINVSTDMTYFKPVDIDYILKKLDKYYEGENHE